MQGFLTMLRAMGLDPEKLKSQAEDFLKRVEERFHRTEEHAADLEVRLQECERRLGILADDEEKNIAKAIEHE